jgi:hypothetical protein
MTGAVSKKISPQKIFIYPAAPVARRPMFDRIRSAALFGIHQATVAIGISLFPVAVFARNRLGINVPVGRLVETTAEVCERTDE